PAVHGAEGRPDRRRLHAHGLGAVGARLCHPAAASGGADLRGHHGVRIRIHAPHPGPVLRFAELDTAALASEGGGHGHIRHARKLDRPGHPEGKGLARSTAKKALKELGGEFKLFFLTMGDYDMVAIYEAPDDAV